MDQETRRLERIAGWVVIGSAIVSLVAASLDPQASATDTRGILKQLVAIGPTHELVHAVQMACVTGYAFSFSVLSMRLGLKRAPVLAGLIAFLLGAVMVLVATINDGFLTIAVANRFAEAPAEDLEAARNLLRFADMGVIYFGDLAFALMGAGAAFWSFVLMGRGMLGRAAGIVGVVGGAATIGAIAWQPSLDIGTLLGIVFAEFCFNLLVGVSLVRGLDAAPESGMRLTPAPAGR